MICESATSFSEPIIRACSRGEHRCALVGFDAAYRVRDASTGLYAPPMIPASQTPRQLSSWIHDATVSGNASDLQLAFSMEINHIGRVAESLTAAEAVSEYVREYMLDLLAQLKSRWLTGSGERVANVWKVEYFRETIADTRETLSPTDSPTWDALRRAKTNWAFQITSAKVWCFFYFSNTALEPVTRISQLASSMEETILAMEAICDLGMLNFLQDSVAFQLFYLAETLCRIYSTTISSFQTCAGSHFFRGKLGWNIEFRC